MIRRDSFVGETIRQPIAMGGKSVNPSDDDRVRYEMPAPGVARLALARPEKRNAQDKQMLYELNNAFDRAAQDDEVKVIILAADGSDFSSGHDLSDRTSIDNFTPVSCWGGFHLPGAEGYMAREEEYYLGLCVRWRNIPKVTIAEVQGRVIAGGLMLIWPCDLIVASRDASFSDPVVAFGVNGVEYFAHVSELGGRRAKEILFTGEAMSAEEALQCGMVNRVVPRAELAERTLELARQVALRPSMGLKLAKLSVNQALDAQGYGAGVQGAFSLHQLGHSHNQQVYGSLINPAGSDVIRASSMRS